MNPSSAHSLTLFGSPNLVGIDGVPVTGPAVQRHRIGLLALLALAPRNRSGRDRLMAYLWPESDGERARALLNQAVYRLRKVLGEHAIVSVGDELVLDTALLGVDVPHFEALLERDDPSTAVELYRGPFMDGFHLGGSPSFDHWVDRERGRLARMYANALEALASNAVTAGDPPGAVRWWRARADQDPYDSRVAVHLMQALCDSGNPAGALRLADLHEDRLGQEFGIPLPDEVVAMRSQLRAPRTPRGGAATTVASRGPGPVTEERGKASHVETEASGHAPTREGGAGQLVTLMAAATLGAAFFWLVTTDGDQRWLDEEAVPAIERALDVADWESAYGVARQIQERAPESRELSELWPRISWVTTLESEPSGALVFRRTYGDGDAAWIEMGRTPLVDIRVPYGLSQLRFELDGHRSLLRALGGAHVNLRELAPGNNPDGALVAPQLFRLDPEEVLPADMVRVPGWNLTLGAQAYDVQDFFVGRYEVTNTEYRRFVEAGGYQRPELWSPIVVGRDTLAWEEAMARFVDRTGRPGPSTWEAGDYPAGGADYPVSGVSWYEADAFARFSERELPTAFHWSRALANAMFPWLLPASNFSRAGPRAVGAGHAMSFVAAFDLAGNVREWTSSALGDDRVILGGSWNDPYYVAGTEDASATPDDRSAGNGIRLALTRDDSTVAARLRAPIARTTASPLVTTQPVSDTVYSAYARLFDYDRLPLNDSMEAVDTTRLWLRERVSFDAAYGPERVILHLYSPRDAVPPYQTVVYWPGWDTFRLDDVDEYFAKQLDFIVKSGRAVAFPIYRGSFERRVREQRQRPDFGTAAYRDNAVHGVKDLRRTLDYLETREDIEHETFSFFGYSWGGVNGPVALAQEPRLRVAIIDIGLLPDMMATPEVDPVNALPRVRTPTLMLSGEFDAMVPLENARRYFELIGVSADRKRHVEAIGGHFIPRPLLMRETLDWLDRWVGAPAPGG